jgi:hypothetical protein
MIILNMTKINLDYNVIAHIDSNIIDSNIIDSNIIDNLKDELISSNKYIITLELDDINFLLVNELDVILLRSLFNEENDLHELMLDVI